MARRTKAPEPMEQEPMTMPTMEQQLPTEQPAPMVGDMQAEQPVTNAADIIPMEPVQTIGREQILEAIETLNRYRAGKASLDRRVIDNEQWYKLRHWECLRKSSSSAVEPVSGWLFNSIANKHADAMDNFPSPNVLPREAGDKEEATILSSIIPVILDQCEFEEVYDETVDNKLRQGTGIYGVFWDSSMHNGIGDITIQSMDVLTLFWEPGIKDIQASANVFSVELMDTKQLTAKYPQLKDRVGGESIATSKYIYDDSVDTTGKTSVVDWYYKKDGLLHYCKFAGDTVLFATENDPEYADKGWYDHGLYPFVFDPLFRVKGTPCGFGFIDVAKSAQEYIDRGNQAVLQNMLANARPRHFIRTDGSVNEEEYADMTRDFVHVDGNLGQDSIMPITPNALQGVYLNIIDSKINELKEVTGNRDISTGGSASGVTAASAIAAMQEAGSKLSRDNNKASYRAFRKLCLMVIEVIRQFYDLPRYFRIVGEDGAADYVEYSNAGIKPQPQFGDDGSDMGLRKPVFDIEVTAQKQSPYSKMAQNELALQFYGAGFFNPQMADAALATLDMMDFDRKTEVIKKVQMNGTMQQQIQQMLAMAQQQDMMLGTNLAQQMAMMLDGGGMAAGMPAGMPAGEAPTMPEEDISGGESSVTRKARERVADSTAPT